MTVVNMQIDAICDKCQRPIVDQAEEDCVRICIENPTLAVDDDGEEFEEGGKYLEIAVVDFNGDPTGEHLCRECATFAIIQKVDDDGDDDNDDDEGGDGPTEPEPVAPASEGETG